MKSKENDVLELFFNSPRHWRFGEIQEKVKITRPQLSNWLKTFQKQGLIKRIKKKGKMPYYLHNFNSPAFKIKKKLFAENKLEELLIHLSTLPKAKVVVLFGSFSRSDWYEDSDIDIFVYGSDDGLRQGEFELKLHRDIQVHLAKDKKDLKRMLKLLPHIMSGNYIKGLVCDMEVEIHAKT